MNSPFETFDLLTLADAAVLLHCSKAHICKAILGRIPGCPPIPAVSLGRRKLIRRESLRQWIVNNEQIAPDDELATLPVRGAGKRAYENSMRKSRSQKGSVKKQRGRWIAMWWEDPNRRSRVVGLVKDMTKSDARGVVGLIIAELEAKLKQSRSWRFGEFVTEIYFPYYSRKCKTSTRGSNMNRVSIHLVESLGSRELTSFRRDELLDLLDGKAQAGLSFSTVDHLRWDLRQVFDMALSEGRIEREAARVPKRVMGIEDQNVYRQSPVASRLPAVNKLEKKLLVM